MNGMIDKRIPIEQDRKYTIMLEKLIKLFNISLTRTQLGILLEYMQTTEPISLEEYMLLINSYCLLYRLDCENRKAEISDINQLLEKTAIHSHPNKPYMIRFIENKHIILKIFLNEY